MGIKSLNLARKVNAISKYKPLQQAMCVFKNVQSLVNKGCYGYKIN